MRKELIIMLCMVLSSLFFGCTKEDEGVNEQKYVGDDFTIEVLHSDATSVDFRITPSDKTMTYVAKMTTKEFMDGFPDDETYIYDDLIWFINAAGQEGIQLEEFLARELQRGVLEDSQEDLDPDTEYYIYAYGMSVVDGTPLTDMHKLSFKTGSATKIDLAFDISVSDIGYREATIRVEPESNRAKYFVNVFSKDDYLFWGGDDDAYAEHLLNLRSYYLGMGKSTDEMIANLCYVGNKQVRVTGLQSGVEYVAYAIGVDDDFLASSDAEVVEFTTNSVEQVDMTFDITLTSVVYDGVGGVVTPSSDEHPYVCTIQRAEILDKYADDRSLIESIVSDIEQTQGNLDGVLCRGTTSFGSDGRLIPETEYVVICFGYDNAPTTGVFSTRFTTPAPSGDAEDMVIEFDIIELTHNSVKIVSRPSLGAWYFVSYAETSRFDDLTGELGSEEAAVAHIINEDIDYGAEYFDCSRAEYLVEVGANLGTYTNWFNMLTPATEYIAFAVAVDVNTGVLASTKCFMSERFSTLDFIYGNARVEFEYGDYYDGSELAQLDPESYLSCTGKAVLPYTIVVNDEARNWYTKCMQGDVEAEGYTDDMIYDNLITYGLNYGDTEVAVNKRSGVVVLPYEVAFSFLGIARDEDGNYGHGTIDVVKLSKNGASPAEEFIAQSGGVEPMRLATAVTAPYKQKVFKRR